MPEWLHDSFHKDVGVSLSVLAVRLGVAFTLGCVVAGVYRLTHGKANGQTTALMATLVLLTVLIGMVTLVIGDNQARAFSLVGALAIIRFRTVVEDTRDTAFVIFAVAVGMAVGAGFLTIPLVGIPFAAAAAFLFRPRRAGSPPGSLDYTLTVRVGVGHDPGALLREPFGKHLKRSLLLATATARQGAAFDLTYGVVLRQEDGALAFVTELNGIAGVQNVELRQM
jgi:hypothetical protein